jgi:hypothetical protein
MARMHCSALPHAVTDADDGRPRSRAHWIWRLDLTRSAGLRRRTRGLRLVHTARLWIRPLAAPCSRERRKRGDDGAASTARDPDGVPRPSWAPRNMQRALYHREKFSPHTRAPPTKRKCLQRSANACNDAPSTACTAFTSHRDECSHSPQPLLPSPCFSSHHPVLKPTTKTHTTPKPNQSKPNRLPSSPRSSTGEEPARHSPSPSPRSSTGEEPARQKSPFPPRSTSSRRHTPSISPLPFLSIPDMAHYTTPDKANYKHSYLSSLILPHDTRPFPHLRFSPLSSRLTPRPPPDPPSLPG